MTANADMIAYWNEVAGAKWVKNQARLDRLMAPLTDALLAAAAPRPGERVLEIGCGCGDLSLQLADAVGPSGKVVAVDVSRPMLAHGRAREAALPPGNRAPIEWVEADASGHAFAAPADLLISRFGVMFFDDRLGAFRNLREAMAPGGRLALLTWRRQTEVEWMQTPVTWLSDLLPMPEDMTGEPGPFGLADEVATIRLLTHAGFEGVVAEPVERSLLIGTSVEDAYALLAETGRAAAMLRDVEEPHRGAALSRLRGGIAARTTDDGLMLGSACWIYRARV